MKYVLISVLMFFCLSCSFLQEDKEDELLYPYFPEKSIAENLDTLGEMLTSCGCMEDSVLLLRNFTSAICNMELEPVHWDINEISIEWIESTLEQKLDRFHRDMASAKCGVTTSVFSDVLDHFGIENRKVEFISKDDVSLSHVSLLVRYPGKDSSIWVLEDAFFLFSAMQHLRNF